MSNSAYNLIKNALDATELRQQMISSNIANVNTPDYKVNKVDFENRLEKAYDGIGMTKTNVRHIGIGNPDEVTAVVTKRTNSIVKENGNNVDIDMEMTDEAATTIQYNALITQLNAKYSMIHSAITK
ncbi:flagellar basal-body rod protein FlgB [Carnobacterium iners]|uniref:Flagellar basal body rod protein FlgB n=1 Tax=Carnobacterium iners TaxID=1073423 RepID=A0A1X7N027_9LACT|nr:flagellar basal body rod protein FlgB [Carnobacterium iners]SEK21667.1 flagellar basal-body rod protein FlgB [Carnobacterium iners]SMH30601.1 flagellar basal-body rod protein FlgB [Carnobacterium iners]